MKHLIITIILAPTMSLAAGLCQQTFLQAPLHLEKIAEVRKAYVQELADKGFENDAYIVDWKVKAEEFRGPLAESGEFVVTRVTPEKRQTWLETVGNDSIGFVVRFDVNPADGQTSYVKTAWLRIGDTVYNFAAIQAEFIFDPTRTQFRKSLASSADFFKQGARDAGFAEATIKMTPEEIATIKKFIEMRTHGEVKATQVIPGTKEVLDPVTGKVKHKAIPDRQIGEAIFPKFNEEKMDLVLEGCAGACTSWMNPLWQHHIDQALVAKLNAIQEKYELFATPVARQLIWRNSRNPHVLGLTLIEGRQIPHEGSFIEKHSWGTLRGMAIYGTIPDPVGDSKMVDSHRTAIKTWLEKQQ
jgi:hypothetical protein